MGAMLWNIQIKLDLPDDSKFMSEVSAQDLSAAMDSEIELFEKWFMGCGNAPLVGVERAILKTYFAWKLRYADDVVDPKD